MSRSHREPSEGPPPPATDGAPPRLFRRDAIEARRSRWLGTVLVAPGIPGTLLAGFALLMAGAVLALLFFAEYTRKARVTGWLAPEAGLVRVFAPRAGVVVAVHAREADAVAAGAPLLTISTELQGEDIGGVGASIVGRLRTQRDSLTAILGIERRMTEQEAADLAQRVASLSRETVLVEQEAALQRTRLELIDRAVGRSRGLRAQGLLTEQRLESAEEDRLEQAVRLQALERARAALDRERAEASTLLASLPLRQARRESEAARAIAVLDAELAAAEADRRIVLTAPQGGTITSLLAELGSGVSTTTPLLGIVPDGARLEAQLFAPSRAIGFLRAGQRVQVRYAAFPYQKFGHHTGEITGFSRSSIAPSELPQSLAGIRELQAAAEPLYRITVSLAAQAVTAYGEARPLHSGMQLDADVLIERRRLIEWALDPLYTVTGRWRS